MRGSERYPDHRPRTAVGKNTRAAEEPNGSGIVSPPRIGDGSRGAIGHIAESATPQDLPDQHDTPRLDRLVHVADESVLELLLVRRSELRPRILCCGHGQQQETDRPQQVRARALPNLFRGVCVPCVHNRLHHLYRHASAPELCTEQRIQSPPKWVVSRSGTTEIPIKWVYLLFDPDLVHVDGLPAQSADNSR